LLVINKPEEKACMSSHKFLRTPILLLTLSILAGLLFTPATARREPVVDSGYVAAIWSDNAVHILDDSMNNVSSFPAGSDRPNGIATDGEIIWTGHYSTTQEVIAYNFQGDILYRWPIEDGLQGMDLFYSQLAISRNSGVIDFYAASTGTYIRSIPGAELGGIEALAFDGELLWQLGNFIYGTNPWTGEILKTIPNSAGNDCEAQGTGMAVSAPGQLTLACTNGNWYIVSAADGSVLDSGNNSLDMYGLKHFPPLPYPPITSDDMYLLYEDVPLSVPAPGLLENDMGQGIMTSTLQTAPLTGTLSLALDGSFTYTPTLDYNGVLTFTYLAHTRGLTDTAAVTLTILAVNDAPVAHNDAYTTVEDIPLHVEAPGVLGNDEDVDGDALTASLVQAPEMGKFILNSDGSFAYTPTLNYNGFVSFTYMASDYALSSTAQVTITVVPPTYIVEAGENQTAQEGQAVAFEGSFTDPGKSENDVQFTTTWNFGDGGTLTGTLTPTHTYADNGIYTVTLTVADSEGGIGSDWLLVTVTNVAPSIGALPDLEGILNQVVTLNGMFDDPGALDTHAVIIQWANNFSQTIQLAAGVTTFSGEFTFTEVGEYTVTVTVIDKDGDQDTGAFTVTVNQARIYLPIIFRN
jgi:hypothetical protein